MNSLPDIKLSDKGFIVKAVYLAGRYGIHAIAILVAIAYVAACFKAFSIVRIAFVLMLPVLFFTALYIAVSEEVDA